MNARRTPLPRGPRPRPSWVPDRWVLGILAGFSVVIGANMLFLYLALENPVQIEASYEAEAR